MAFGDRQHSAQVLREHPDHVEGHARVFEQPEAGVDVGAQEPVRVGPVVDEVANAAEQRPLEELAQPLAGDIGFVQRNVADHPRDKGIAVSHLEHEISVVVVVRGLHEYAAGHSGRREFGQHLVHADGAIQHARVGAEPGVLGPVEVPDVLVRVDDVIHGRSSLTARSGLMNSAVEADRSPKLCPWQRTHPTSPLPVRVRTW